MLCPQTTVLKSSQQLPLPGNSGLKRSADDVLEQDKAKSVAADESRGSGHRTAGEEDLHFSDFVAAAESTVSRTKPQIAGLKSGKPKQAYAPSPSQTADRKTQADLDAALKLIGEFEREAAQAREAQRQAKERGVERDEKCNILVDSLTEAFKTQDSLNVELQISQAETNALTQKLMAVERQHKLMLAQRQARDVLRKAEESRLREQTNALRAELSETQSQEGLSLAFFKKAASPQTTSSYRDLMCSALVLKARGFTAERQFEEAMAQYQQLQMKSAKDSLAEHWEKTSLKYRHMSKKTASAHQRIAMQKLADAKNHTP